MIFKPYQECTEQKVYQAVTDDLPAAFVDGTVLGGHSEMRSLVVMEKLAGRHVELHAAYIGVTVVVRQLGRYLTLAVRMPHELATAYDETQDLQLCVNGCPASERIELPALGLQHTSALPTLPPLPPHQQAFTVESASRTCSEQLQLQDIYFHSCVFDLLTTGDANFTAAASSALKDVEALHPEKERWHIFPYSRAGPRAAPFLDALLVCLFVAAVL